MNDPNAPQGDPNGTHGGNVYDGGKSDARQLDQTTLPADCKLFRKRYRALSPPEIALHDAIKDKAEELAVLFASINNPPNEQATYQRGTPAAVLSMVANNNGAHVTIALRHLEDAVYRAVKALTA